MGPARHISCFRMEAKHQYFKKLVRAMNWLGNVPKTLASRHARWHSLKFYKSKMKPQRLGAVQAHSGVEPFVESFDLANPHLIGKLLLSLPEVSQQLLGAQTGTVRYNVHSAWEYCTYPLSHGSHIALKEGSVVVIGEVQSLLEVVGQYAVTYHKYGSGLVEFNGHICVNSSTLGSDLHVALMDPRHVQCAHVIPTGTHSYVVSF